MELIIRWSRLHRFRLISPDSGLSAKGVRDLYIKMLFVLRQIVLFSIGGLLGRKRLLLLLLNLIDLRKRLRGRWPVRWPGGFSIVNDIMRHSANCNIDQLMSIYIYA